MNALALIVVQRDEYETRPRYERNDIAAHYYSRDMYQRYL